MIQHKDMHTHCTPDAHGHCHCHGHTHSHGHGAGHAKAFMRIGISLLMLAAGMAATSLVHLDIGAGWRLAWYILAFLPVGLPVMAEGWKTVRGGDVFNEFTLMTIACVGAFCIGEYPEAVGVMLFYSLGETLQDLAVGKATRDISRLVGDSVRMALVWRGDRLEKVRPEDVAVGDEIEVRPGGMVPLDGILLGGDAVFDTSARAPRGRWPPEGRCSRGWSRPAAWRVCASTGCIPTAPCRVSCRWCATPPRARRGPSSS